MNAETTVTIGMVLVAFVTAGAALGVFVYYQRLFSAQRDAFRLEIGKLEKALAELRLEVARDYMSKALGADTFRQIVEELRGLRNDLREDMAVMRNDIQDLRGRVYAPAPTRA